MVRGKCMVCDSPNATNYHFGAQSCKACAAFFRRSIAMDQCYECLGDGVHSCKIDHTLRLNCRHCRLKKCQKAGMMRDLVQAKREIKSDKGKNSRNSSQSEDFFSPPPEQPGPSNYFDQFPWQASENEMDPYPSSPKIRKMSENLMGIDELQQFIQIPAGVDDFPDIFTDSDEIRSRMTSISEASAYVTGMEEEERLFGLAGLYTEQVINLNMRRRITYTDRLLGSVFDAPCVCPYDKADLKLFDHRTYRQKNRNDYTMILDYINRFPEFESLSKSEKNLPDRRCASHRKWRVPSNESNAEGRKSKGQREFPFG
ncbi:Nuclear receptor domain-containing protein [Caenorhabditis elegans]|uniref:Nuclear receptor domain-containing protein n=1 Tax=Caenorhabditis elegans TaxID=6239 RepID=J7SF88_CAEEL|nr:Nuclear receptor domain-containing protein [Caenorhabditis elegans]CCM09391.1 Nuclear receptor domain-containing protein [Caenorhabditis elegans]|eukprot:NP_001263935.1 Nuclear hormone receptor family member nhr-79 [Caenorhabditis elegans]